MADLQLGLDLRFSKLIPFGPFIDLSLSEFGTESYYDANGNGLGARRSARRCTAGLTLGVRAQFNPVGERLVATFRGVREPQSRWPPPLGGVFAALSSGLERERFVEELAERLLRRARSAARLTKTATSHAAGSARTTLTSGFDGGRELDAGER